MKKSHEEIEALKKDWEDRKRCNEHYFILEEKNGFEEYKEELKRYRETMEKLWYLESFFERASYLGLDNVIHGFNDLNWKIEALTDKVLDLESKRNLTEGDN